MFGSLVVILPTAHEGGQFVLRQGEKEWTLDFTDRFAAATKPSACFVAFYGDIEHEILPITSGYRVTLTYNLYHQPIHPGASSIPTPFYVKLKQALVNLVNDKSKLPNGGYLGFGLVHEYVHTGYDVLGSLLGQLKGSDRALADVCDELGLRYSLRLFYRKIIEETFNLITTKELDVEDGHVYTFDSTSSQHLKEALEGLTIEEVEGVTLIGAERPFDPRFLDEDDEDYGYCSFLKPLHRTPVTEVLEITRMQSSVDFSTPFMTYGNQAELEYFYGTACMLIAVEPAESRDFIGL